jgi:NAD(P)-dependent dehydrogenase (short-subunit alcohol dehydrogenase family)
MRLEGQVVLVTGASRGLGRAVALAVAEEGARLILAARDRQALRSVADLVNQLGCDALVVECDVRDPAAITALAERALGGLGRVDTLVNAAGAGMYRPFAAMAPAEWDELFATQVRGTMLTIQALLPAMIERKRGNIINLVAQLDMLALPGLAAYAAASHAVAGLTRTLAQELRPHGINVNGLHPGGLADTALMRGMSGSPGFPTHLLDPSIITPAAVALALQPPHGLTGDIIDAVAWNTDAGLGAGLG